MTIVATPSESQYNNALPLNFQAISIFIIDDLLLYSCDNYTTPGIMYHARDKMPSTFTNALATTRAFIEGHEQFPRA